MTDCPAVLDLGWDELVTCDRAAGHTGPHHSEAWGPQTISWLGAAA